MTGPTMSFEQRFWSKVDFLSDPHGCWLWTASTRGGYGQFYTEPGRIPPAHRVAYEAVIGPIPEGLHIDHMCRQPLCVNPNHLEPVTQRENIRRGASPSSLRALQTHCGNGHPFTPENTYLNGPRRYRNCRKCHAAHERIRKAARRAA